MREDVQQVEGFGAKPEGQGNKDEFWVNNKAGTGRSQRKISIQTLSAPSCISHTARITYVLKLKLLLMIHERKNTNICEINPWTIN